VEGLISGLPTTARNALPGEAGADQIKTRKRAGTMSAQPPKPHPATRRCFIRDVFAIRTNATTLLASAVVSGERLRHSVCVVAIK